MKPEYELMNHAIAQERNIRQGEKVDPKDCIPTQAELIDDYEEGKLSLLVERQKYETLDQINDIMCPELVAGEVMAALGDLGFSAEIKLSVGNLIKIKAEEKLHKVLDVLG